MSWCWHLSHQHRTGDDEGEGIRPETTYTGNDQEEENKLSLHLMGNHEEGASGSNLGQNQSPPLSEAGCFLSNLIKIFFHLKLIRN